MSRHLRRRWLGRGAGDLQHRPGRAIHLRGVHRCAQDTRRGDQIDQFRSMKRPKTQCTSLLSDRSGISKELVDYFRPRFLEIIVYGHSYVVSDGRYRKPRELDLNALFRVPRERGREKDVSLFQRLDTAYQMQQGMDAAKRAGKRWSFTSVSKQVSKQIHCGEKTARNRYNEFTNILKIFDQDRFFQWRKSLNAEHAILKSRLKCAWRQARSGK